MPAARVPEAAPRRRPIRRVWTRIARLTRTIASAAEWLFGLASLLVGLSTLAALPMLQFLSLGYLLESSARVARSGRLRDGFVGVRRAARIGGLAAGIWLATVPAWLVGTVARSAELIDPGGRAARGWRVGPVRRGRPDGLPRPGGLRRGGRLRHFLWPFGHPFWLIRRLRAGGPVRRVPRRLLGVRRGAPAAVLLPARVRRLPRHARLADRAGDPDRGRRPGAAAGDRRRPAPGDRRAVPAVLADPLRPGGPDLGPVLAAGDPRAVPPRPVGLRLLADDPAAGGHPAVSAEDRDDPARGRLAAEPGLRRVPRPGAAADRLGLLPAPAAAIDPATGSSASWGDSPSSPPPPSTSSSSSSPSTPPGAAPPASTTSTPSCCPCRSSRCSIPMSHLNDRCPDIIAAFTQITSSGRGCRVNSKKLR